MANITLVHDIDLERRSAATPMETDGDFRDSYIMEQSVNTNHGGNTVVSIGVWYTGEKEPGPEFAEWRGLFYYYIPNFIPKDAVIVSAIWHPYVLAFSATILHNFEIFRIDYASYPWIENEVTWANYDALNTWTDANHEGTTPSLDLGAISTVGWKSFDITTMFNDARNNRGGILAFVCRRTDGIMATSDGTISIRPKDGWDGWPVGAWPEQVHHVRVTYTLAGKTFQAFVFDGIEVSGADIALSGIIGVQSTLVGDLERDLALAGPIDIQSSLDAALVRDLALSGPIAAQSALSALLGRLRPITGTIDATSLLVADIRIARPLTGTIDAVAVISGSVGVDLSLGGTIEAQSSLAAAIRVLRPLQGVIAGQSSIGGAVQMLHSLGGTIAAVSIVSGNLAVLLNLSGVLVAVCTIDGRLSVIPAILMAHGATARAVPDPLLGDAQRSKELS